MRTEANKSYDSGFVLTEPELRRIVGIAEDQIRKLPGNQTPINSFQIKYRNGALATTSSLEDVLNQENHGSAQIVELRFTCQTDDTPSSNSISMNFINPDFAGDPQTKPISFIVRGDARDWTFITSSLLEERASKIKRIPLIRYFGVSGEVLVQIYLMTALIGVVIGFFFYISSFRVDTSDSFPYYEPQLPALSEELDASFKAKPIKDASEAMIVREQVIENRSKKEREQRDQWFAERRKTPSGPQRTEIPWYLQVTFFGLLLPVIFFSMRTFILRYFPVYNFCWGDYLDVFQKRESVRKFVIVVLLIGILVSFVGGILANLIRIGR